MERWAASRPHQMEVNLCRWAVLQAVEWIRDGPLPSHQSEWKPQDGGVVLVFSGPLSTSPNLTVGSGWHSESYNDKLWLRLHCNSRWVTIPKRHPSRCIPHWIPVIPTETRFIIDMFHLHTGSSLFSCSFLCEPIWNKWYRVPIAISLIESLEVT